MLAPILPKKSFEVALKFKPVVMSEAFNNIRPEKADFFAESDQTLLSHKKPKVIAAPKKLLKFLGLLKPGPKSPKNAQNLAYKSKSADDFLAKSKAADPLGIRDLPEAASNAGAGAHAEHLPHIAPGDHTELNTWSWRHAPFFNRIKTQIGQVWAPNRQIARFDPQGTLLGQKIGGTGLSVTIDPKGKLKTLLVAHSSGVAHLQRRS